jgi:hypothetical protein
MRICPYKECTESMVLQHSDWLNIYFGTTLWVSILGAKKNSFLKALASEVVSYLNYLLCHRDICYTFSTKWVLRSYHAKTCIRQGISPLEIADNLTAKTSRDRTFLPKVSEVKPGWDRMVRSEFEPGCPKIFKII